MTMHTDAAPFEIDFDETFDAPTPDNSPFAPSDRAYSLDSADVPLEGGTDPTFGTVRWRTLVNGHSDDPKDLVFGIAEFEAGGTLLPHRHRQAEIYFGLEGDGVVTIEGVAHRIAAGVVIYVPGEVEHGTVAGPDGLKFAYGFAERSFAEIDYRFSAQMA
ncbi:MULTISPECIES: cupin domain-containing protein [Shimia]|uniref:cupin domain-containing protein n=1 Tax=Shimia TaxID=573139 RepID=UPI001FB4C4A9|nr:MULTISPECIES: cupin domain-containing protein [Shimia]MDV4145150.1 cupin domain-containing protein [Shimia sp. FJ5]